MKDIWNYLKRIILIGFIPICAFWISIILAFLIYPEDMNGASIFTIIGCLISIFLCILNIIRDYKQ